MSATRVKICGMTRARDVEAAAEMGASAVGFNCYPKSPRYAVPQLRDLAGSVPAFVTPVLLFVNASESDVRRALDAVPNATLQFHGDETVAQCERFQRPFLRAISMNEGVDLLDCEREYGSAIGLLADTPSQGYGGSGRGFDWSRLPGRSVRSKPLILAGGLSSENVGAAIVAIQPYAVDVASGVEDSPGMKSVLKMRAFFAAVRAADQSLQTS